MMNLGGASQVASLFVKIGADARQFETAMGGVERRLGGVGGAITRFGAIAGAVAIGGITAIGVGLTSSLKAAAEFDKVISGAGAVLNATTEDMEALADAAMRIGKDTAFSASEAAGAMEMLAKNGLNTTQILEGAADATIALAAATGANLTTAADVATSAMLQFGLTTDQMGKAINGITGVVVASKFGIEDYALALSQGGGVAAAVGVSFEDFNAAITATSTAFGSGSDAGTSFKTFMQRLVPQSKEATEAMARLGLITADGVNTFFDANGQMKSMVGIAGVLQNAFSGLSDAARIDAFSTIFGTDAMRFAAKLSEVGAQGIVDALQAISKVDAADQAARRLDNLAGDVEQLGGSFDTLKIKLGKAFTPLARRGVQWLTKGINKLLDMDFDKFADAVSDGIDNIGKAAKSVGGIVDWLFAGLGRIRTLAGDFLRPFAGPLSELFAQLQGGFANGFGTMNLSGPVNGLLTELIDAWLKMQSWMTGTALPALLTALGTWGAALVEWIAPKVPGILAELGAMFGNLLQWVVSVAPDIWAKLTEWGAAFVGWIAPAIPLLLTKLGEMWSGLVAWITDSEKRALIVTRLGEWGAAFADWAVGLWPTLVTKLSDFWTNGLLPWFTDGEKRGQIVTKLEEWRDAFLDWAGGLWGNVSAKLGEMWSDFQGWITDPTKQAELRDSIAQKWRGFVDWAGNVWAEIQPKLAEMYKKMNDWLNTNVPQLQAWGAAFREFFGGVRAQFQTELPFLEGRWTKFQEHMLTELDRIGKAFGGTFGPGGSMAYFGEFFTKAMATIGNIFLTLIESMVIKLRVLAESFMAIWEIGKALAAGDMVKAAEGLAQLGTAISGFADMWTTWRNLIDSTILQWSPVPNGEPTPPPGGWFGSDSTDGSRRGSRSGGGSTININISGDGSALPADRSKLRELARAIWREAEMAGMRV